MKQRVTVDLAELDFGRVHRRARLHVADHVLLDEEAQVAVVQVLGQRRRQRQDVGGQLPHLLRHLQLRHRVADQRLVDVEVEEPHLGVGDAPHRLHVDAHQLQEGDEREAGGEDAGAVAQRRRSSGVSSRCRPFGVPRMTRIRSISSGSSPVSAATCSIVTVSSEPEKSSSVKPKASRPSRPASRRSSSE